MREGMEQRVQRLVDAARRTLKEQQALAGGARTFADLMQETGLADARLAFDQEHLAIAMDRLLPAVECDAELAFAADDAPCELAEGEEAVDMQFVAQRLPGILCRKTFQGLLAEEAEGEGAAGELAGELRDDHRIGPRDGLKPRGQR